MATVADSSAALKGRRVLVIGLGRTGFAMVRYLVSAGARVRACDRRSEGALLPAEIASAVEVELGREDPELLTNIDLVVPSPGVPATASILEAAVKRGLPVVSEIEIAARALEAPIIAITGTNGKSTTTSLIGAMLEQAGLRVFTGGNLGTPLVEAVGAKLDAVVAEVSSFQLEWVDGFHPRVAALLNVTDDHLDRYTGLDHYAAVKARIFARQQASDFAILNRDDAVVMSFAPDLRADVRSFGMRPLPRATCGTQSFGAEIRADAIVLVEPGGPVSLSLAHTHLLGVHNQENMMAAALAARAFGAAPAHLQAALDGFTGLRHRMEVVAERGGVRYLDDSKGTNVGALLRSLEGLPDGRVVLIAGGMAKGGDYGVARTALSSKVRHLILYGRDRALLADCWRGVTETQSFDAFADAVGAARHAAAPGDVVLLSPACASMDQFRDYAARGDAFAALVREGGAG